MHSLIALWSLPIPYQTLREMTNFVEYTGARCFTTPGESHIGTRRVRTRHVSESVISLTLLTRRVKTSRGLNTSSTSCQGVSRLWYFTAWLHTELVCLCIARKLDLWPFLTLWAKHSACNACSSDNNDPCDFSNSVSYFQNHDAISAEISIHSFLFIRLYFKRIARLILAKF